MSVTVPVDLQPGAAQLVARSPTGLAYNPNPQVTITDAPAPTGLDPTEIADFGPTTTAAGEEAQRSTDDPERASTDGSPGWLPVLVVGLVALAAVVTWQVLRRR